jgi:hypothetical protein
MKELRLEYPEEFRDVSFEWRVREGDTVRPGDLLAVVSTDKASQELEAFDSMRLLEIRRTPRGYLLIVDEITESP